MFKQGPESFNASESPENVDGRQEKIAGTISGPMSELLGMHGTAGIELFNSMVLDRHGIAPELLDYLGDTVAHEFMRDFVFPLLDPEVVKSPELQDQLAAEAADELNRLIVESRGKAA